jgi:hypothetical protein
VTDTTQIDPANDHRGEDGWCGFCNGGGGHLGETGDERSLYLRASVRTGTPGAWTYEPHPHTLPDVAVNLILWCGVCDDGLAHRFARYDDQNLRAILAANKCRLFIDPLRWDAWELSAGTQEYEDALVTQDDTAVHVEKLNIQTFIELTGRELKRRGVTPLKVTWTISASD